MLLRYSSWLLFKFCWKLPEEPKLTDAENRLLGRALVLVVGPRKKKLLAGQSLACLQIPDALDAENSR